jgi:hypothetical protein
MRPSIPGMPHKPAETGGDDVLIRLDGHVRSRVALRDHHQHGDPQSKHEQGIPES